jgi:hypothetical protein
LRIDLSILRLGAICGPINSNEENCMTKKTIIRLAVALAATVTSCGGYLLAGSRAPQEQTGRCSVVIPNGWGEYVGAGSYGLEFKDEAGTIRFVKQFPCGLEGAPVVSLEVRRK